MRLLIASDFHASERTWRKFVNAIKANVYDIDVALVAGDLTGKALVPIVGDEKAGWTADLLGRTRRARGEEDLLALEREIADVGYYSVRLNPADHLALTANPPAVAERFQEAMRQRLQAW